MSEAQARIFGFRPLLWTSLCKFRDTKSPQLPADVRRVALDALAGEDLVHAIAGLHRSGLPERLRGFLASARTRLRLQLEPVNLPLPRPRHRDMRVLDQRARVHWHG